MNLIFLSIISLSVYFFQKFIETKNMGAQCMATTVNEHYSKYLQAIKVSELKDYWTTIQLYKMKKIYEKKSSKHPEYSKHTHITFEKFKEIFPQIQKYQEIHKKRLFEIFDHDSQGYVDWNNFYASISICYFGSQELLSVIMFMIFDDFLSKTLNHQQLTVLCQSNTDFIVQNHQTPMYQPQQVVQQLLKGKPSIGIQQWLKLSQKYFQFGKYRRFFNIFVEEQMEKELAKNFNKWNNLYQESQERYISYVISYKWFESWKIYILEQYGTTLGVMNPQNAYRTFKTKKTIKSLKDDNLNKSAKKVADLHHLHQLKIKYDKVESPSQIKNYDYIHSNIGQRPRQIYNNVLQGEFQQILKNELIQNRDYVFVSQKVWDFLKKIYEGYPEFRRTGVDSIQLYPKLVRIYSQMFRDKIDYSSEVVREVSGYLSIQQLLTKSLQVSLEQLNQKVVFFKTIGMIRWQQLPDLSYLFTQLSPQSIIFLFYIDKSEVENFKKTHYKVNKQINEITVGDYLTFTESSGKSATGKKLDKIAVYMGKNLQGKCVLHFPGQSYIYDLCVMEQQLFRKGKVLNNQSFKADNMKLKKKAKSDLIGISSVKGIGFINSVILNLYMNENFRKNILLVNNNAVQKQFNDKELIEILADIFNKLQKKEKVDASDIIDMVDIYLGQFQNFEFSMCQSFLDEFLNKLIKQFQVKQMKNWVSKQYMYQIKKKVVCGQCNQPFETTEEKKYLSLPIPQKNQNYFEIIFVPFSKTLKSEDIKKYGFKLASNATFKDYKQAFQAVAQIDSTNTHYILAQVYSNNIIKNFSTTKPEATLAQCCLRQNDVIFAFELFVNFDGFIMDHYSVGKDVINKDFKVDQFIDCKHDERGWIFGKIRQIQYLPYTHRTIFRVIHKFSKNQQWEISYDLNQDNIGNFPTKSYLNAEQYHLRLLQRYYNQPSNEMQICNIPLVTVLTSWMRWKQFYYLIYLQLKPFIKDQFSFKDEENNQQNQPMKLYSAKSIDTKNTRGKSKTNKMKLNKFKDYLYSDQFPYKVSFTDRDGRCAICFKFLKMLVLKGENGSYCQGCSLSTYEPISWQIKPADVMVCIDWKNIGYFNKNIVKDHSSYINLQVNKINDSQQLVNCLNQRLDNDYIGQEQPLCCNKLRKCTIHQRMVKNPQNLIIMLQRIVEDQGFKRTIHRHVSFNLQDFEVNGQMYELYGVTAIQGTSKNTKYTVYIIKDKNTGQWHQFDGEHVSIVKKNVIEKICAYVLYYKKKK